MVLLARIPTSNADTLSWTNPTLNEDGTPCVDLKTIELGIGCQSKNYYMVSDVGLTNTADIQVVTPTYYAVRAVDTSGNRSQWSNEIFLVPPEARSALIQKLDRMLSDLDVYIRGLMDKK